MLIQEVLKHNCLPSEMEKKGENKGGCKLPGKSVREMTLAAASGFGSSDDDDQLGLLVKLRK